MRYSSPMKIKSCGAAFTTSLCTLFLVCSAVRAEPALPEGFRQSIEQGVQSGLYQAVAVGWIDGKDRATWFFGPAQADSAFEIGAVTEVFTGLLLAQAAYEGKLRLQTPIRELLAADFPFTDAALGAVTLEALATHHAGLPAIPPNLMPGKVDDPYADYSEQNLRSFLASYKRTSVAPGYAYSTLDVGLLGYLLGRAYATDFTKLLNDKILRPLELKHTGFEDGSALLAGHARGQTAARWHFAALAGSAGLRSTTNDLLDLLQRNLLPEDAPLRAALLLARHPRAQNSAEEIGLGWNILQVSSPQIGAGESVASVQTWPLVWRASSTAGFSTFIGFRTDRQQALVLLGNTDAGLSAIGLALLKGDAPPPLPLAQPAQPTPEQLAAYPGLYQVRGGIEVIVRQRDAQLSAQLSGQPAALLHADSEDVFDAGAEGFGVSFQRVAGKVTTLLLNRGGVNLLADRLSERAPHVARAPIAVDAKSLPDYVGDYHLGANALARIGLRSDKLSLQITGRAPLSLFAFANDHFASEDDSCVLAFQRDTAGKVASLRVDFAGTEGEAPRVRWTTP
jgi:D-alanyl-D-alanine-carboxypeptidase/D-alanyl-D-alanine-endopeptidase